MDEYERKRARFGSFSYIDAFKSTASMFYCGHSSCKFPETLWQCNPHNRSDRDDAFGVETQWVVRDGPRRRVIFIFASSSVILNAVARCRLLVTLNFLHVSMFFASTFFTTYQLFYTYVIRGWGIQFCMQNFYKTAVYLLSIDFSFKKRILRCQKLS